MSKNDKKELKDRKLSWTADKRSEQSRRQKEKWAIVKSLMENEGLSRKEAWARLRGEVVVRQQSKPLASGVLTVDDVLAHIGDAKSFVSKVGGFDSACKLLEVVARASEM